MFGNSNGARLQPGQDDVRPTGHAGPRGPKRGWLGVRHRREIPDRIDSVSACPACGLPIRDHTAARLGFCDRCQEFTGMCGAGRRIVCPDLMTRTTWHTPCTELGAVAWEIAQGRVMSKVVLCKEHDMQVRFGGTPWIGHAAPLDPVNSRRPRQSVTRHGL